MSLKRVAFVFYANMIFNETIVAISTPPGRGAIAIIRLTGNRAIQITDSIFSGKVKLNEVKTRTIHFGKIINPDNGETIDHVLVSIFRAPNSYTGSDVVEINCHGGYINTEMILNLIVNNGARIAGPGEFTKLAYLNGKIDLTQVEAIADIIHAKTHKAHRTFISQYSGVLSEELNHIKNHLINTASLIELDIDFADEQLLQIDNEKIIGEINEAYTSVHNLLLTYQNAHLIRDGAKICIVGKPNVGKSSLMNILLQKNRAIVSEFPGTTRDYLEESIEINGIPFSIIDTAGLRHTENPVEQTGIIAAKDQIRESDLVLFVIDASQPADDNDQKVFATIQEFHQIDLEKKIIIVKNKSDIGNVIKENFFRNLDCKEVLLSAKNMTGLEDLKDTIKDLFRINYPYDAPIVSNIRHKIALESCLLHLDHAKESFHQNISFEYISLDIRNAIDSLKEILGEITSEDILKNIFSNFCIGK